MSKSFIFLSVLTCLIFSGCDSPDKKTNEPRFQNNDKQINKQANRRRYQHDDKRINKRTAEKRCSAYLPEIKREWRLIINHIAKVSSNLPELNEKLNSVKRKIRNRYTADLSDLCYVIVDEWLILEYAWSEIVTIIKSSNSGTEVGTDAVLGLSRAFDIKEGYVIVIAVKLLKYIKNIFSDNSKSSLENTLINISKDELILEAERRASFAKYHKERVIKFIESRH